MPPSCQSLPPDPLHQGQIVCSIRLHIKEQSHNRIILANWLPRKESATQFLIFSRILAPRSRSRTVSCTSLTEFLEPWGVCHASWVA